jgi:hypothetical protein
MYHAWPMGATSTTASRSCIRPRLWREREPSSGTFQIVIDRRGRVRHALPLETFSTGGEDALRALVPDMRFVPVERQGESIVVVARVEVSIEAPL